MSTATAQLNVRMDPRLKKAGDAGLAEIGLSPSEAVRALWSRAARRGEDAALVKDLLAGTNATTHAEAAAENSHQSEAERLGWNIVPAGLAKLGIELAPHAQDWPSDEELLVQALKERMQERGLE